MFDRIRLTNRCSSRSTVFFRKKYKLVRSREENFPQIIVSIEFMVPPVTQPAPTNSNSNSNSNNLPTNRSERETKKHDRR